MIKRWLRVTLPHDTFVAAFVLAYLLVEGLFPAWVQWVWGVQPPHELGDSLLHLAALVYSVHRVISFHPVFNSAYQNWLAATPWTSRNPLPVGPIHLVIQDALVLGILACLAGARHPAVS